MRLDKLTSHTHTVKMSVSDRKYVVRCGCGYVTVNIGFRYRAYNAIYHICITKRIEKTHIWNMISEKQEIPCMLLELHLFRKNINVSTYLFDPDTIRLLASALLLKRSRYFLVNPPKWNIFRENKYRIECLCVVDYVYVQTHSLLCFLPLPHSILATGHHLA